MTPGLFGEAPPGPTPRGELERRLRELVAAYSAAGGDEARRIDREILELRRRLGRLPRPAPLRRPTQVNPKAHDGRLAATGEGQEDEDA